MAEPLNYCSNCKKLPVCKYATKITQMDVAVKNFNTENEGMPTRISISNTSYLCRHKEKI